MSGSASKSADGNQGNKRHRSKIECFQSISVEDGDIDRISSLPTDVIDRILELMPVRDAARTCVLSSRWTDIWPEHPTLILDLKFWDDIKQNRRMPVDFASNIVNRIFLCHYGHINKFVIDISVVKRKRHSDIGLWLSLLCKRGVNVLRIINSKSHSHYYVVRSYRFNNSQLTDLGISNCTLYRNDTYGDFHKLVTLSLDNVYLVGRLPIFPLLTSLTLKDCHNMVAYLTISAPQLVSLNICGNSGLALMSFLSCTNMRCAYISLCPNETMMLKFMESADLIKLFRSWPKISEFLLDGASLKYLARGIVPEEFPHVPNLRRFVPFWIDCDFDQCRWILCILKNSPLMSNFEIWFSDTSSINDLEVENYLEDPNTMKQMMEQLHVVKMKYFRASRAQILFTKILLRCAPSLKQMLVEENGKLDAIVRLRISKELMRLPRASPNAEIIFERNLFPAEDATPCVKF